MKKIIIIIALMSLVFASFAYFLISEHNKNPNPQNNEIIPGNNVQKDEIPDNEDNTDIETTEHPADTGTGAGGGGGSSGETAATGDVVKEDKPIPSDIDEKECGFYFSEYDICTGKCPQGECTSEGRSCYCKK